MENLHDGIEILIYRFLTGELAPDEQVRLNEWLLDPKHKELFERICNKERLLESTLRYDQYNREAAWRHFESKWLYRRRSMLFWWVRVASFVLPLCLAVCFWMREERKEVVFVEDEKVEITPAVSGARMLLSSGEIVYLESDTNDMIFFDGGRLVREDSGVMAYATDSLDDTELKYNQVFTPRGCEYKIRLSDGTVVWLNAESSLRFPRMFVGKERKVYAEGELYFEVSFDESKPFIVETKDNLSVKVLGTEFNLRSYDGEFTATTLIRGKVRVENMENQIVLSPGQQAIRVNGCDEIQVKEVDVNHVVAWHRGYFFFENTCLEEIMAEIGRWYDVQVFFENTAVRNKRFSIEMRRHACFEDVLALIERTGVVRMRIQQDRVFVK